MMGFAEKKKPRISKRKAQRRYIKKIFLAEKEGKYRRLDGMRLWQNLSVDKVEKTLGKIVDREIEKGKPP